MGQAQAPPKVALVVGWNSAGKTAVIQRIKGRSSEPMPTTGVLREVCKLKIGPETGTQIECELELIDVGTVPKIEAKTAGYTPYLAMADCVIVVVDATRTWMKFRPEDVDKAKNLIKTVVNEPEVRDKPFLFLANKCDREDALPVPEVMEVFGLEDVFKGKLWQLQRCSAITAEGLKPGVAWLVSKITEEKKEDSGNSGGSSSGYSSVIR